MLKRIRSILSYNFIPPEHEENLKSYKYAAEDHSLLYNYIFSPMAAFCVEYTPENIAPNLITLAGLFCILIPYLIIWYFVPYDLQTEVPGWIFFMTFAFHFLYFHLDNMDGKQARKTGNSSALGLIFDHGCDAISVYLQATTMIIAFNMEPGLWQIFILMTPSIMFFLTNLEELYTHKMYLPIINPAVEGVVLTGMIMLIPAIWGQQAMAKEIEWPIIGTFTLGQSICIVFHFVSAVSIPMIFNRIYQKVGFGKLCEAIRKLWFVSFTHGSVIYFVLQSQIAPTYMRYVILLQGFNMCKQLTLMLIASSSKSEYRPFSPISFSIIVAFFLNTFFAANGLPHFDEANFLITLVVISFIIYIHFIKNVTGQICRVLNIKCFKVKEKSQQFETLYEVQQQLS